MLPLISSFRCLAFSMIVSRVSNIKASVGQACTHAGSLDGVLSKHMVHLLTLPVSGSDWGTSKGHALTQNLHPMHFSESITTAPLSYLVMACTGQAGRHAGSFQCLEFQLKKRHFVSSAGWVCSSVNLMCGVVV